MGAALQHELCCLSGWPAATGPFARPSSAEGTFLRIVMVSDVYKLDNFAHVRAAIDQTRAESSTLDCVVLPVLTGDFLSPCALSTMDGGVAMMQAVNMSGIELVMFGNHAFDLRGLQERIVEFDGHWINSNVTKPAFVGKNSKPLPEHIVVKVGKRKVAVAAFIADNPELFSSCPSVTAPAEAMVDTWDTVVELHGVVDAFVPMTHFSLKQDKEFAEFIARHAELKSLTPVLLGGHDHEACAEQAGNSLVFKVGANAQSIGIVDIWWTEEGQIQRALHMYAGSNWQPEPKCKTFVDEQLGRIRDLARTRILHLPADTRWGSTRVRFKAEPLASLLLKLVKDDMSGVDLVMMNGGAFRGDATYTSGAFTEADLLNEFSLLTEIAVVDLPGDVLEQSIAGSRTKLPAGVRSFFLHCDSDAIVSDGEGVKLVSVNGAPFDASRMYKVATYHGLVAGVGDIQPMRNYVRDHGACPPLASCLGIKHYIMRTLTRRAWGNLVSGGAGGSTDAKAKKLFENIDENRSGFLEENELEDFLDSLGNDAVKHLFEFHVLDNNKDGRVSIQELLAVAQPNV